MDTHVGPTPTDESSAARSGAATPSHAPDPDRWAVMAGTGDLLALVLGRIHRLDLDDITEMAVAHELVEGLARAARNLASWGMREESQCIDDLQALLAVRLQETQEVHYARLREVMAAEGQVVQ